MSHQVGYDDLIKVVLENNPQANSVMIEEAYEFAREMHEGQYRKSGEPYIIHPVNVAIILADLGLDDNAIAAGLLHDVVEDTDCSSLDLERKFNEEVAFLVEGVTKLDKIQCHSKEERQLESYRKMFIAMAQDVRVIIIKLADRLHNMRTMSFQSPEKQKRIAQETLEIYSPLADRLGIIKLKWELEDLSLKYLDPDGYREIITYLDSKADVLNEALNQARVEETALNIPKIHEVTVIGGKWAIVSDFIKGKTLSALMEENPDKKDEYLTLFVNLQLEMHRQVCPELPKLRDKMNRKISMTDFDATTRYDLHTRLDGMPRHTKLCHGDFNPSNVIIAEEARHISSTGRTLRRVMRPPMRRAPTFCSASPAMKQPPRSISNCSARRATRQDSMYRSGCRLLQLPSRSRATKRNASSCSPGSTLWTTNNRRTTS